MSENILIGTGLSSLGFMENINKDKDFIIYDKNTYFGGHAYSFKIDNFYFDEGAHISHSKNKEFLEYIDAFNSEKFRQLKCKVYNFYKNKKIGYPIQFNLKDLTFSEKIKYLISSIIVRKKLKNCKNYYEWLVASYGKFLTEKYYKMYTKKYWRTNYQEMSTDWIKGRLVEKNIFKTLKSLYFTTNDESLVYNEFRYPIQGGFFNFFEQKFKKFQFNLGYDVNKIDIKNKLVQFKNGKTLNYKILVSSIPLSEYKNLLVKVPRWIVNYLEDLKYTKLLTYNYKVKKKVSHDFHWCYFYDEEFPISRMSILNNFNKKKNDKYYFVQAEVFFRNDEKIDFKDYDLRTKKQIIKFFKLQGDEDLVFEKKVLIEKAYPVPIIGDQIKINKVINWLKENDIYPIGLYGNWKFMWSDQTFLNGKNTAFEINKL